MIQLKIVHDLLSQWFLLHDIQVKGNWISNYEGEWKKIHSELNLLYNYLSNFRCRQKVFCLGNQFCLYCLDKYTGNRNIKLVGLFTQGFLTAITLQIDAAIGWSNLGFITFWPIISSNTLHIVIKSWTDILDITLEVSEKIIGGATVVKF